MVIMRRSHTLRGQRNIRNPASSLISLLATGVLAAVLLAACAKTIRPSEPIRGERFRLPEGAVAVRRDARTSHVDLEESLSQALGNRFAGEFERDESGYPVFRVLALSGGGSRGAYGAGLLVGWTASGTRPKFDVVTGISTGALIATFAFLGPAYDDLLRRYTNIDNEDVFTKRNAITGMFSDALRDTMPLRRLIASQIDADTLAGVAREHAAGRRLFVGTTNLDAGAFTMWDMGELAASDRPDKLQRFHDIILASASFPMIFPPVYIPVEFNGETRWQMHVDGSARANIFAANFMLDLDDAIERSDFAPENVQGELWVIHNGQPPKPVNDPVAPQVIAIGEAAIKSLLETSARSGIAELYTLAMLNGFDFWYASIPPDVVLNKSPLDFDRGEMNMLFELGYEDGRSGDVWQLQPPPAEPFELLQILNPEVLRSAGGRYPEIPQRPPRWMQGQADISENAQLDLCTGPRFGNYHRVGEDIRQRLHASGLQVDLVETEGSNENLQRISDGSCEAAIVQHDAYFLHVYGNSHSGEEQRTLRPKYLFDDFVHVVCNHESAVRRLTDLLGEPGRQRVLVGEPRSGSAVTWKLFTRLNTAYRAVPTESIGGMPALSEVAGSGRPACLFYVASLGTPFMQEVDIASDRLTLVAVDDPRLKDTQIGGEKLYQFERFPEGSYEKLQTKLQRPDIPTVTVGVSVVIAAEWARRFKQANRVLLNAIAQTRRAIAVTGIER